MSHTEKLPSTLSLLSTCTPPCTGRAWQTAPHPQHPYIAVACADKTVRIYSLTSFTLLSTITGGHKRSVRSCAWKPSLASDKNHESTLATGSFDATAAIWVGKPGQEVIDAGYGDWGNGVQGEEDDEDDFRFAVVLEGHDSEIKSIAWSAHGTFLATCSRDKSVWLWEALGEDSGGFRGGGMLSAAGGGADDEDNYETVAVLQEHDGDVKCVSWHPTEEQCLASGSYDEMLRIWREDIDGEWGCVGVCEGHDGTLWCVEWEPWGSDANEEGQQVEMKSEESTEAESGPRIMTSSADSTIKLWRRKPKKKAVGLTGSRMPSIIRSSSDDEEWFEDGQLPQRHEGAIYAVSWSRKSKRVISCGSDGKLVVYKEQERQTEDTAMTGVETHTNGDANHSSPTSWSVVAEIDDAHGVFEVNHVCWARRFDRQRRSSEEEIIISTGDDGEVKVWTLNDA